MLRRPCPGGLVWAAAWTVICLWAPSGAAADEAAARPATARVALFSDAGTSASSQTVWNVLAQDESIQAARLSAEEIRAGRLNEFDVLIHPGGSGSKQGAALGEEGRQQVRQFVQQGGGYIGICAGAYLASCNYTWSLHILNAKVVDSKHWNRGYGNVDLSLSPAGRKLLNVPSDRCVIYYHQGPLLAPSESEQVPPYEPLATFESEIARNGAPSGVMQGTTAIARGAFGEGRVVCFSPHPERTDGLEPMVHRAIAWAAGR